MKRIIALALAIIMLVSTPMEMLASEVVNVDENWLEQEMSTSEEVEDETMSEAEVEEESTSDEVVEEESTSEVVEEEESTSEAVEEEESTSDEVVEEETTGEAEVEEESTSDEVVEEESTSEAVVEETTEEATEVEVEETTEETIENIMEEETEVVVEETTEAIVEEVEKGLSSETELNVFESEKKANQAYTLISISWLDENGNYAYKQTGNMFDEGITFTEAFEILEENGKYAQLMEGITHYGGLQHQGWRFECNGIKGMNGNIQSSYNTIYIYAEYDKVPIISNVFYYSSEDIKCTASEIKIVEKGTTYKDFISPQINISNLEHTSKLGSLKGWSHNIINVNSQLESFNFIHYNAVYDKQAIQIYVIYHNEEGCQIKLTKLKGVEKGTTYGDVVNMFAPELNKYEHDKNLTFDYWQTSYDYEPEILEHEITETIGLDGQPLISYSAQYLEGYPSGEGCFVGFYGNGGAVEIHEKLLYNNAPVGALPTPERRGYTFTGWYTDPVGGVRISENTIFDPTEYVKVYAHWTKNPIVDYIITYELNGGKNNSSNPTSYDTTTETITLKNPTRKGYTFAGWYSDSSYKTKVTQIKKGSTGDKILYAKWTAHKYNIAFNGNGATSGTMSSLTNRSYGTSYTLTTNAFKKTGYKFTGWNTKADGSGTTYANKASVKNLSSKNKATVTLYAQWQKVKYTITYQLNGGKNSSSNPTSYYVTTATKTLQNPTRKGYTFAGWYSDSSYKTKVTQIKKGSTGNKTLYAKWTAHKYNIAFNGNGATSGKMSTLTSRSYGKSYTLTTNAYKRTGYKFIGWNTKADGSGTAYANKVSVKNLSSKNKATVTLYAQWQKVKYTISYELNGGTNNKNNPTSYYVTTATKKLQNPTRKGYTFKGWYSDSKYKNKVTEIKKGSTGNKTLYAKWTVNQYTIKFDGNGATSGKMSSLTNRSYGKAYTLTANAYKRTGYKFTGWNTKADGSGKSYANKASVKSLSSKNKATVTLYAQWQKVKYTITYELNGGTNNKNNPTSYYVTTATKELQNPTKTGYRFKGWYSDSKYKTKVREIKKGSTGNKTLYAKWEVNKYSIAFNGNGATSGKMSSLTSRSYGKSYTLTTNAFKRTDYKFTGWNTKADGSGKTYANKASVKNLSSKNGATVTLYAQWQKVKYTVTYELNGGTNNKNNPTSYYVTTATKTLQNPTKIGYTFNGWYSDAAFKTKVTEIKKGSTGNKKFYAKWTANKYTIKFDGNGSTSGSMSSLTNRVYDKEYTLPVNTFEKTEYEFVGWNTKADGTGISYLDGAVIKNLMDTNGKSVTLYAQWTPAVQKAMWFMADLYITQVPGGDYSHIGTQNFDVVGANDNRDIFAPFDCVVKAIYTGEDYGNTIIIESVDKVYYADGSYDYMSMAFAHDNDISDLYVGKLIKQGEVFYQTGDYGYVTGVHSHVTCIRGQYQNDFWTKTSYDTYSSPNGISPTSALFISKDTNIVNTMGLQFIVLN